MYAWAEDCSEKGGKKHLTVTDEPVLSVFKSLFYHNNASHVGEAGYCSQLAAFVRARWKSSYHT